MPSANPFHASSSSVSPLKRKAMSITQTYYLAHTARGKLSHEAARADHNLRLLVGHANLLDSLMLELAEAEQEQESWFNQSVRSASPTPSAAAASASSPNRHIQWADTIVEEPEADWQAEDVDSDSDSESESDFDEDDADVHMASAGLVQISSAHPTTYTTPKPFYSEDMEEEIEDDGEEDYAMLTLTRTHSRSAAPPSPPELLLSHDDSDSSDDESMPPSPPTAVLPAFDATTTTQKKQGAAAMGGPRPEEDSEAESGKLSPTEQRSFFDDGYYLPARRQGLVSTVSVY